MRKTSFTLPLLAGAVLAFLFVFTNCKTERRAKPLPPNIGEYVYAFTTGTISKNSEVRVQLVGAVVSEDKIGSDVEAGVFNISPSVGGKAVWENAQTILFQPEKQFPSGASYVAKVNLNKLFQNLPKDAENFEFDFRIRDMFVELDVEGVQAVDENDLSKQQIIGAVLTSDIAEDADVEKTLTAKQNGNNLPIEWNHDADQMRHQFTVLNVARGKEPGSVTLNWTGKPVGYSKSDEEIVEIPALGDFKVTDVRVVQEGEQYLAVHFSDPLLANQDLNGLVQIMSYDGGLQFAIDGNNLRVYPSGRAAGTYQVRIEADILNSQNAKMTTPAQWSVSFDQDKPAVRLVGKGVIMPNSKGLTFPFEAVNLNAVEVEVFKIHNNNILQFLQTNDLSGSNELERVGRVVMQKKVPLSQLNRKADQSAWSRYALDLSQLIQQDPSAIYQVRIGFRPNYSNFVCDGTDEAKNKDANMAQVLDRMDENGEINSFWNDWYGIEGYYDDYNWEDREDPCKPAYYNSDNFIQRNVIASDLGITAKTGKDNSVFVAISNLITTDPVSGAKVDFYDFQNQLLKSVQTDGEGVFLTDLPKKPYVLIATKGEAKGYLRMADGHALSLSKFDVAGEETQKGIKGFLYGERGVWRPGDTLFLNFVLADETKKLPLNHPITFELYDARGQLQKKTSSIQNVNGIYPLTTPTPSDAPTGTWMAKVKVGGATFTKNLKIETVKPNRLKINLDFKKEALTAADEPLDGNLEVSWLHGAPAKNLKAIVEVQLKSVSTKFEKYPDYEFTDPARSFSAEPRVLFDGTLDSDGKAAVSATLLQNKTVPGKLAASFKTRAFEKSGDFSADNFTLPYSPYNSYTGLALPKNKWGQERFEMEKEGSIAFVSVDEKGNPLKNKKLDVGVYRIDWNWWWDNDNSNVARFNSTNHIGALQNAAVQTDATGKAKWNLTLNESGRYLARVCDAQSGHCAGRYFYVGYPWWDEEDDGSRQNDVTALTFTANKSKFDVGETVELQVPSGEIGRILLTLEDGTKVLETRWHKAKSGVNKITFPATKEMVPTVYAHVSLMQPHAQTKNDLPIRLYGVIPIEVEDKQTVLNPVLKMPDVLQPDQTVKVEVSEQNGKAMAYTIAVVDDGLLDLTRFKTPNPHDALFAREALGVKTWDVYDQVLGAYGGELERVLSIGGDADLKPGAAKNTANRFKPVVKHLGPFLLKKGQKAAHSIKIPNYVGSVRTMVVAADIGAYGATEKTTPVRKPLMLLATLPRVLGPGETLRLPVNVFAMESKVKNVNVSVEEASGLAIFTDGKNQNLSFNRPGDQMAYFEFKVAEKTGIAKFNIKANGGGETATQQIEIEIRNPNPYVTRTISQTIEVGKSWETDFEPVGMAGTNTGTLEISSIPPIELNKRLKYLLQYPYGCLEQTLSTGFPQLYVDKLMPLDDATKKRVTGNVQATVDKLRNFQNEQGNFNYWPGNNYYNHWTNSYAGHFLVEAKALGYSIPANMLERWEKSTARAVKAWNPDHDQYGFYNYESSQLAQAYALYALALTGKPELGAMNRLREMKNLSNSSKWRLAAAYAASGKTDVANQLVTNLSTEVEDYREISYNFGSGTRDRALILETMTLLGQRSQAGEIIREISEDLSGNDWLSTQDIAYSLMAIAKFIGKDKPTDSFAFEYKTGNGKLVSGGSRTPIVQVEVPTGNGNRKVFLKNTGKNILFARLILSGQPVAGQEKSEANKLQIAVNYRTMDGKPLDIDHIAQGTDFVAEVTVTHPALYSGSLKEMALAQIFPSGWEITNSRMDGIEYFSNTSRPTYQDIRDDRVNSFFEIAPKSSKIYRVVLNAAYPGRFYHPAVSCEAMYDNSVYARQAGRWVEVRAADEAEI